jgi:hypothetical protein
MLLRKLEEFSPYVGQSFQLAAETGEERPLVLAAAAALSYRGGPGRQDPFRLTFRGGAERVLPQGTYRLPHPVLGPVEIFLVPNGIDQDGAVYDALFN